MNEVTIYYRELMTSLSRNKKIARTFLIIMMSPLAPLYVTGRNVSGYRYVPGRNVSGYRYVPGRNVSGYR